MRLAVSKATPRLYVTNALGRRKISARLMLYPYRSREGELTHVREQAQRLRRVGNIDEREAIRHLNDLFDCMEVCIQWSNVRTACTNL